MMGLEHGRAADAVAAEHADDLAGFDIEIDALDDVALAVKKRMQAPAPRISAGSAAPPVIMKTTPVAACGPAPR